MVFGMSKKKDPICGMKQEKGKGVDHGKNWFCSEKCKDEFYDKIRAQHKKMKKRGCCCH